ncbi:pirin family protein [Ornithinimicrobium sp. LYQ121]|uniref:pirin family protein n=1 Tax=Ornithinimicrobium sp. LYQ121 TaxID=3378801 RepID=UPI00385336D5
MSDLQVRPGEHTSGRDAMHPGSSIIAPREVPLGGPRAMTVRRTLPARGRTMIGAWCFVDHYGPDDVAQTGGMVVPPHPHTALQTVSWLFSGRVEHRDSTGAHAVVVPGQLNLMTAGHGVSHSEVSTPDTTLLHGVQLWTALPFEHRDVPPSFQHHEPEPVELVGATLTVFLGSLAVADGPGATSPVTTYSPLLGAEVRLQPGAEVTLVLDPAFEHGVLLDRGELHVNGCPLERSHLLHEAPGPTTMTLTAGAEGADAIVLGGTPFGEEIVMWWNFIGRTHEDIVTAREQWQAELASAQDGRFGAVDYPGDSLPAPALPPVRLRPRA